MKVFENRVAVVTGGASGMGLAMAARFAAEKMKVVIADVEAEALSRAETSLREGGAEVLAVQTDVASWHQMDRLASATRDRFGGAHVVCLNAGVVTAGPAEQLTLEDWQWVLGVNLWGVIHGVKAFVPMLREQEEGHLLATSSTAGLIAAPAIAPYNVTKFGVVALMETLQRELAADKAPIGVSVLCPGNVATRITDSGRNRPETLADHADTEAGRRFDTGAGKLIAEGLDPAIVADQVLDAIRHDRFWILTHPEWKELLRARIESLVEEDRLPRRYP